MASITVLIADDHPVVRKGLQEIFAVEDEVDIIGEAEDGQQTVAMTRQLKPAVVLMDLKLPKMDGIAAIREIKKYLPEVRVLVLTSFEIDEDIRGSIEAGADGYLLKDTPSEEIIKAVYTVFDGGSFLHPSITKKLLGEVRAGFSKKDEPTFGLTPREKEVLRLMAKGSKNQQIAKKLWISETTVKAHVSKILQKLGTADRVQTIVKAVQQRLIDLND